MWRVLAVEDSPDAQRLIARALDRRVELRVVSGLDEARGALARERVDLVLLDISLPDGDGFQLCAWMQNRDATRDIPVVFLTGRSAVEDKVLAFSLGADDYVEKPFDAAELRARVETKLRKVREREERDEELVAGALVIRPQFLRASLHQADGERELGLTPREFALLNFLARRPERVLSRGQLLSAVWPDAVVGERTVDTHVSNLRRKLGAGSGCIQTVSTVGYRFVCQALDQDS